MIVSAQGKKPKVLLYDVESTPNRGYCWEKYEQDIIEFDRERQIITFAYKWLGEKEVHAYSLPDFPSFQADISDNKALIQKLHDVMSEANIVVGHNVNQFDDRMANADFLRHGLNPPPPHRTVDTLAFARSKFRLNSNKLDDLGKILGVGRKVKHEGFSLWRKCMDGDTEALKRMVRYNKQDVVLLVAVYLKLRPCMAHHPNMNAIDKNDGCPVCRSRNLMSRGFSIFGGGKRPRFKCKDCGKWSSGVVIQGRWEFRGRA